MNRHPDTLWIRDNGTHYHIKPCALIENDYFEIPYGKLNRHRYRACMCVFAYYRWQEVLFPKVITT